MSDDELLKPMHGSMPGDWWNVGAAFVQLAAYLPDTYHPRPTAPSGAIRGEYRVMVHGGISGSGELGEAIFTGNDGRTDITIRPANTASIGYWQRAVERLRMFVETARDLRRDALGPSGEEVIELYYRSKAAGGKVTLKALAEQYGFNRKYLSNVKRAYDARGGWGAKSITTVDTK
jgi:hypothetical protein